MPMKMAIKSQTSCLAQKRDTAFPCKNREKDHETHCYVTSVLAKAKTGKLSALY